MHVLIIYFLIVMYFQMHLFDRIVFVKGTTKRDFLQCPHGLIRRSRKG